MGIYLQGSGAALNFDVTANETVAGVIGDDTGSAAAASYAAAAGYLEGKVGIVESGAATLTLSAANTYTGGTTLDSGTLDLTNISGAGTGAITFEPGANATLQIVPNASLQTPANTIDGFAPLDTIDLAGVGLASSDSLGANNLLTVFFGAAKATLQLNPAASYAGEVFQISSDGSTGTDLTLATDPGPAITAAAPSVVEKGRTTEIATVTPGFAGDSLTLHQMTGVGTLSLQLASGVEEVIYTAPASITTSSTDTVTYTVTDADNLTANGAGTITLDAGPTITAVTPLTVEKGQTTEIGTVALGEPGDALTLTQTGGSGTLSLQLVSGVNEVIYTQTASIVASTTDVVSYTVKDQHNDAVASGSATVTLDAGPALASTPPSKIGHGQTVTVGTVTPGLAGDTETLGLLTAPNYGTLALASGTVTYTAPSTVPANGETDSFRYEIVDQHNDAAAIGSATVTLDPGPALASVPPTKVGYGQTAVIGTVTAGLAGDAETLKVLTAPAYGTLVLNNGTVSYKAPGTVPTGETDHFSYEITDQLGDISAVATDAITLDPGPSAAIAKIPVKFGSTTDLTGAILATVTPGLAGDSETITAIGSTSPNGSETLTSGAVSFAASGGSLQHIPANGSTTASFSYTVTDQLGETSSSTVQVTVSNPASNIYGSTNGNSTIQGTPGADVVTAYAYNNTIYDNGGNDLV